MARQYRWSRSVLHFAYCCWCAWFSQFPCKFFKIKAAFSSLNLALIPIFQSQRVIFPAKMRSTKVHFNDIMIGASILLAVAILTKMPAVSLYLFIPSLINSVISVSLSLLALCLSDRNCADSHVKASQSQDASQDQTNAVRYKDTVPRSLPFT